MDFKAALAGYEAELVPLKAQLPGQTEPVYYRTMSVAMGDRVARKTKAAGNIEDGEKLAIVLVECLLDKDGNRLLDASDKQAMMQLPVGLMVDMVNEIQATPSIEDAEGN